MPSFGFTSTGQGKQPHQRAQLQPRPRFLPNKSVTKAQHKHLFWPEKLSSGPAKGGRGEEPPEQPSSTSDVPDLAPKESRRARGTERGFGVLGCARTTHRHQAQLLGLGWVRHVQIDRQGLRRGKLLLGPASAASNGKNRKSFRSSVPGRARGSK